VSFNSLKKQECLTIISGTDNYNLGQSVFNV
jgi:hypothetical protein